MHNDFILKNPHLGFSIVRKTQALTNPQRHFHNSWELLYIVSGTRNFFHANHTVSISSGDFVCVRPGIFHRGINLHNEVCDIINIYFDDIHSPFFNALLPLLDTWATDDNPIISIKDIDRYKIINALMHIAQEINKQQSGFIQMSWALLIQLIVDLSRYISHKKNISKDLEMNKIIISIIDYLSHNYHKQLSLQFISKKFNVSESYLSRIFHKSTHFTFVEYLNSLRVQHACRIIISTNKKITVIAEECGFGSITQFGRCFKKYIGTSPLLYKKTHGDYKKPHNIL